MKTTVKYIVLKSIDYQLGTSLFEDEFDADAQYFDQIPSIIEYQNLRFKVVSKEQKEWIKELNKRGYYATYVKGFDEAQKVIDEYFKGAI